MLERLTRDLRSGTRDGLIRAARQAYALALGVLAVPGVVLGVILLLSAPPQTPGPAVAGLLLLGVGLAAVALYLAYQAARRADLPARQAALTAAIQAATAPGVLLLLGCALLGQPLAVAAFWALALGTYALVWRQLPGWVRDPEPQDERLPSS
ncbi:MULTISPECIES: hypothetical protein [Deinococcus]|uniref:Integral membrane protein n=1 Tax=Deinococcus rufus TaxID=2136097 RepID=A0ABV7Z5D6_9DEIO|nr:hypothetical protein [Deinococcus sp. AB2017081]WQE96583.1 hypothetical protein U2P90_06705 [Deinococcus sp. AB2017081]